MNSIMNNTNLQRLNMYVNERGKEREREKENSFINLQAQSS